MSEHSEVRDGMRIDWDVPIEMDDGLVLRRGKKSFSAVRVG